MNQGIIIIHTTNTDTNTQTYKHWAYMLGANMNNVLNTFQIHVLIEKNEQTRWTTVLVFNHVVCELEWYKL